MYHNRVSSARLSATRAFCFCSAVVAGFLQPYAMADDDPLYVRQDCLQESVQIAWSDPPDGFVDVRQDTGPSGEPQGIARIEVKFSSAVDLTVDCIQVLTSANEAPLVEDLSGSGTDWVIELDQPIPSGESTALFFWRGEVALVIHSRPGDVNFDGVSDREDVAALQSALDGGSNDLARYDISRDGTIDFDDVNGLREMLDGGYDGTVWRDTGPTVICCCADGVCNTYQSDVCPQGETSGGCPCVPNPCGGWIP